VTPLRFGVAALTLVVAAAALAVGWSYRALHRSPADWPAAPVDIRLETGLTAGQMFDRLSERGVLRHQRLLEIWLRWKGGSERLHAGEYRFEQPQSPLDLLARLERGDVLLYTVTVPEGLVIEEIVGLLVDAGFGPAEALLSAFNDAAPIRQLDATATSLEGYLFPETYKFPRNAAADVIASTMLRRFHEVVGQDFPARVAAAGLSVNQAVTLASMIEEETSVPEERPLISRVFHNRLERGMQLQCDPTVVYALMKAGRRVEKLSRRDLEFDSPWNTYRVRGLPPSPIANPGAASLEAAVRPAEGDQLYFVAAPGGGHRFSNDLESHLTAVAEWRRYVRSSR